MTANHSLRTLLVYWTPPLHLAAPKLRNCTIYDKHIGIWMAKNVNTKAEMHWVKLHLTGMSAQGTSFPKLLSASHHQWDTAHDDFFYKSTVHTYVLPHFIQFYTTSIQSFNSPQVNKRYIIVQYLYSASKVYSIEIIDFKIIGWTGFIKLKE
jgi:hypothetical protein